MSNHELSIRLSLQDEITKRLQGVQGAIGKLISVAQGIGELGQKMERLGRNMTFLGGVITGPFAIAFRTAAQYSEPIRKEMEGLSAIFAAFQVQIAQAVLPILEGLVNCFGQLYNAFMRLSPETRNAVLQSTLLIGVWFTLGGIVLNLAGRIMMLTKQIAALAIVTSVFNPIQLAIIGVTIALAGLIVFWDKLKNIAVPVISAIEQGLLLLDTILYAVFSSCIRWITLAIKPFERLLYLLSQVPGPQQKAMRAVADTAKGVLVGLDTVAQGSWDIAGRAGNQMISVFQGKTSALADAVGKVHDKVFGIGGAMNNAFDVDKFTHDMEIMKQNAQEKFNAIKELVKGIANAMEQTLGDSFYKIFTGKLSNLKEIFADFGNSILKVLASVLAKLVMIKALTAVAGGSGKIFGVAIGELFHNGGIVKKMHTGGEVIRAHSGLAVDEVPIIAQTGEGVLSRKGMNALGRSNFESLNRGASLQSNSAGRTVNNNFNITIQAVDMKSFEQLLYEKRDAISNIFGDAIKRNDPIVRGMSRRY